MSKWITIDILTPTPGRKTQQWSVNTTGGTRLGIIQWLPAWRCYSYFPAPSTIYEEECMREIADFCERATNNHKGKSNG